MPNLSDRAPRARHRKTASGQRPRLSRRTTAVLAVLPPLLVGAGDIGLLATSSTASAATAPVASAAALSPLNLQLSGTSIAVSGAMTSGANSVSILATAKRGGEPVLFHLNPGVTPAVLGAALSSNNVDPNALAAYGSIVMDVSVNPGRSAVQVNLPSGNYVALDVSNQKGAPPHTLFTISPNPHPATLPKPDAVVAAIEFGFVGASTLHPGELVRFQDNGYLVHMIVGIGVRNMADAHRLVTLLKQGNDNAAQKLAISSIGFQGPVMHGAVQQERIVAKPGVYVLACFMDTQDGREHTQLGMEKIIQIR